MADASTTPVADDDHLKKDAISAAGIVFLVLAAASPLIGLTGAVPSAMVVGNGLGVSLAYVVVGLILLLFAVGYVAMAHQVTNAGALYAYIGRGLGSTVGFGAASVAIWAYTVVQIAIYAFFGVVAGGSLNGWLGLEIPWWVWTLVLVALVQVFGYLQIDVGAKVLGVLLVLEWGTMIVLGISIAVQGGAGEGFAAAEVLSPATLLSGAPGVALVFAFASMFGFEAAAIYGEEVRDPKRSVPRATYLSITLVLLFFAFTSWMLVSAHGASNATAAAGKALESGDATSWVFAPITAQFGGWAGDALPILLTTSLFAGVLAFHNSANRYLFSLGRDGLLPRGLTAVNRRHSPWAAGGVQTVISLALVMPFALLGKDPVLSLFSWFSGVAVLAVMLLYFLTSVSVVVFFRRERLDTRAWNTLIAPVLGALGIAGAIWLILANFTTLIGGDQDTAMWLELTVPAVLVLGVIAARLTRGRAMADV